IAWPPTENPAAAWPDEHRRIAQSLQNRRLPALALAAGDDGVRKLFQFPIQFQAAGRFLQEWLAALCRPAPHPAAPRRGCSFPSCFHAQPLDAGRGLAARETAAPDKSVFLSSSQSSIQGATGVRDALDKQGFFVRGLLTRVLPADKGLAHP